MGCVVHVTSEGELRAAVESWIGDDPDPGDRAELRELADRAFGGADAGGDPDSGALATKKAAVPKNKS